ncbi:hypothetical protein SASPL_114065 [Salvia splendens]|uniref:Zinc finger LSD1-type domain-containing protein n=1 Tax=Salvia splendens TaxID=180675 RepID=A0A8X8Y591_SALSN|nr:hypothetical protein SASPL_114065 [Salvia splendens]
MGEDISMVEEEEIAAAAAAVNAAEEVVVEEEEDDDGPPPGFQFILTLQPPDYDDEEEEDGPPPGFNFVAPKPPQLLPSSDWHVAFVDNVFKLAKSSSRRFVTPDISDVKEESNEDLDEGPPPGWESVLTCQMPQPQTPPLQPPSTVSSNCEMGSKPKTTEMDDEMHQSESEKIPTPGQSSPATPPTQQLLLSEQPSDAVNKEEENKNDEKRPTPMPQPASPLQQLQSKPHSLTPVPKSSSSEKAQLVCGTCRKLCLYPQGAKWIRCPGCQEVNFVLAGNIRLMQKTVASSQRFVMSNPWTDVTQPSAAHEVGQVNCGGCAVLLMYPHGAPAVQCSSCRFVTEIGCLRVEDYFVLNLYKGDSIAVCGRVLSNHDGREPYMQQPGRVFYKDPVLKDKQWSAYIDRSPGSVRYAEIPGCSYKFDIPAEKLEQVHARPQKLPPEEKLRPPAAESRLPLVYVPCGDEVLNTSA